MGVRSGASSVVASQVRSVDDISEVLVGVHAIPENGSFFLSNGKV